MSDLHRVSDGWCEQCRLAQRRLAFHCPRELRRTRRTARGGRSTNPSDALAVDGELSRLAAERRFYLGAAEWWPGAVDAAADQALASAACDYAANSPRFVARDSRPRRTNDPSSRSPAPRDVVLRHRSTIYFRTTRALVGRALTAVGRITWAGEAHLSAAQAISCSLRSRDALLQYPQDEERDALVCRIDEIVQGLTDRFPRAAAWRHQCIHRSRRTKDNHEHDECEI